MISLFLQISVYDNRQVDIALDPFPYPGGTTSAESLWMGVPVLTMEGKNFLSRVGETIIKNAGYSNWVASSKDDYIKKAIKFSNVYSTFNHAKYDECFKS